MLMRFSTKQHNGITPGAERIVDFDMCFCIGGILPIRSQGPYSELLMSPLAIMPGVTRSCPTH